MTKTKVLKLDPAKPDEEALVFAAKLIKDGKLVAFPTETVYGIGANFLDKKAINRLYEIKNRPRNKPFTVHVSDIETIKKMGCEISPFAKKLIEAFWPGPLTVILKLTGKKPPRFGGPKETAPVRRSKKQVRTGAVETGRLGFRMPKNRIAKELIEKSGVPVAAPSANLSGEAPPVEANEILRNLDGKIDLVLDGGRTEFAEESTIVDATAEPYKILRRGAISEDEIAKI